MSENEQPAGRGRSLIEQLLRMAQTRLEMLSVEVQHEKLLLMRELRLAITAAVCGALAVLALLLWVALALGPEPRFILLGALFVALAIISIVSAVLLWRSLRRERPLRRLIHQLRLDRASMGSDS